MNINNIETLKKYISTLKNSVKNKCVCNKNENIKYFSRGQNVKVCKNTVIKGTKNNIVSRIEKINNLQSIKLDNSTLNLLIQTIIKKYYDKKLLNNYNVEHYNKLCKNNKDLIRLVSKRSDYKDSNGINYNTLQNYIINSKDNIEVKVEFIKKCLLQVFKQLDRLYEDIQFHYCDSKAGQLILFNNKNNVKCMLSDLDKVTFTILINGKPYRIRVTKDIKKHTMKGILLTGLEKIGGLEKLRTMSHESFPQKSNLLEKIVFISSCCLLINDKTYSIYLRNTMLYDVLKSYNISIHSSHYKKIIKLESYYKKFISLSLFLKKGSTTESSKYVDYNYLCRIKEIKDKNVLTDEKNLKSIINLKKDDNNNIILNITPTQNINEI